MSKTVISSKPISRVALRTLNLFILNKLSLLDESPEVDVISIAERLVGLHAKRAQSPYLSVHARNQKLGPEALDSAIYQDRTLLRAHCMRGTVHLLPLSQYRTVVSATAGQLDGMYRRAFDESANKQTVEAIALDLIEKRGPLSHAEIAAELKVEVGERDLYLILNELCTRGILVKATVNGSWRSSVYNYELLARWQPNIPAGDGNADTARSRLIEWYLAAYGPATLADIAWWTGLSQAQVKKAIAGVKRPLSTLHFTAIGADALILDSDRLMLEQWQPPARPQVNFLPGFDPFVMAYADRRRYIAPEHYGKVFKRVSGIIEPVVLMDGWIVGSWKYAIVNGELDTKIFEPPKNRRVEQAIEEAAKKTSAFILRADEGRRASWEETDHTATADR